MKSVPPGSQKACRASSGGRSCLLERHVGEEADGDQSNREHQDDLWANLDSGGLLFKESQQSSTRRWHRSLASPALLSSAAQGMLSEEDDRTWRSLKPSRARRNCDLYLRRSYSLNIVCPRVARTCEKKTGAPRSRLEKNIDSDRVTFYTSPTLCVGSILKILPAWMMGRARGPLPIIAASIIFRITNDQGTVENEDGLRE